MFAELRQKIKIIEIFETNRGKNASPSEKEKRIHDF